MACLKNVIFNFFIFFHLTHVQMIQFFSYHSKRCCSLELQIVLYVKGEQSTTRGPYINLKNFTTKMLNCISKQHN